MPSFRHLCMSVTKKLTGHIGLLALQKGNKAMVLQMSPNGHCGTTVMPQNGCCGKKNACLKMVVVANKSCLKLVIVANKSCLIRSLWHINHFSKCVL